LKIIDLNVTADNRHYFIMEFLHGKPLQDLAQPDAPVPLETAGPILLQVCEALQAAHDHKIIHRDLKPDNVYLIIHKGRKNFVKVVDFGIAKLTDSSGQSTGKTQAGMVMGTPAYMSPEQASGMTAKIDGRSDIYSLGVMMFQLATGKLPFPGTSFGEVLIGHLQVPPPEPRTLNAQIPEEYQGIILKCLEKNQDDRYQSMRELHDVLGACLDATRISRELPAASAADAATAAAPSQAWTKSSPAKTPVHATSPVRRAPAARTRAPTAAAPAPAAPSAVRTALYAGLGVMAVAVIGGAIAFGLHRVATQRQEREDEARLELENRDRDRKAEDARRAAAAETPAEAVTIFLSISSLPGAGIVAKWGNEPPARGQSTLVLPVPKGTVVHVQASLAGHETMTENVIADASRALPMLLRKTPRKRERPAAAGRTAKDTSPVDVIELDDFDEVREKK